MSDEPLDTSPEAEARARTEIRRGAVRNEHSGGRPLKGNERRVRISNRFEPTMIAELNALTGLSVGEFVERMHGILKVVSEYRAAKARVVDELERLIVPQSDKGAA